MEDMLATPALSGVATARVERSSAVVTILIDVCLNTKGAGWIEYLCEYMIVV
jgi:hypothetical protein